MTAPVFLPPDAQAFRAAMSRPASTVAILTSGTGDQRVGVTITATCSLSDDPPSVLACLHRQSSALQVIRATGHFALNFLSAGQAELAGVFAGRTGLKGAARFESAGWGRMATGAPTHGGALCVFDCELAGEMDSPTHAVLMGRVRALAQHEGLQALVYSDRSFTTVRAEAAAV